MGKIILILFLLFNTYGAAPPGTGNGTVEGDAGYLDHYMELMDQQEERGPVSMDEQVRVLNELGITLSEDTITSCRGFFEECEKENIYGYEYVVPLVTEGNGVYDFTHDTWTPSSRQVFSMGGEVYDVEGMYQLYLQGLQSISEGELTFSDVTADYSKADFDTPDGTVDVRFKLNGRECQFTARFMGDWIDFHIRDEVNRCLEELGVEKRFYSVVFDNEIVFFCTEEWAQKFEAATLCYISDKVDH